MSATQPAAVRPTSLDLDTNRNDVVMPVNKEPRRSFGLGKKSFTLSALMTSSRSTRTDSTGSTTSSSSTPMSPTSPTSDSNNPTSPSTSRTPGRRSLTMKRSRSVGLDRRSSSFTTGSPDESGFQAHPSWSPSLTTAVRILRTTLIMNKDNLARARSLVNLGTAPVPFSVKIEKLYLPRRSDIVLDGMTPEEAEGKIKAEWVDYHPVPDGVNALFERVVLYLHGGAYFICSRKTHRTMTWRVAKYAKARTLVVDYRLAPESVFPLALQDAISSYLFLTEKLGYKPEQIVVMGDSAGGGLSFALMLWLRDNPAYGMPAGLALMSPWLDLKHSMPSFKVHAVHDYLPEQAKDPQYIHDNRFHFYCKDNSQLDHPLVSPFYSKEDSERPVPPMLIQVGGAERLRDEILHTVKNTYKNSPIQLEVYEGMVHVFQMFATIQKISEQAMQRLGEFAVHVTDPQFEPSHFHRQLTFVAASKGFPETVLTDGDVDAMLEDTKMRYLSQSVGASSVTVGASSVTIRRATQENRVASVSQQ